MGHILKKLPQRTIYWSEEELSCIYSVVCNCIYGAYGLFDRIGKNIKFLVYENHGDINVIINPFYVKERDNIGLCNDVAYHCWNRLCYFFRNFNKNAKVYVVKGREEVYFKEMTHYFLVAFKDNLKKIDEDKSFIIIDPSLKRVLFPFDSRYNSYSIDKVISDPHILIKRSASLSIIIPEHISGVVFPVYYSYRYGLLVLLRLIKQNPSERRNSVDINILLRDYKGNEWSLSFYNFIKLANNFDEDEYLINLAHNLLNLEIVKK